MKTANAHRRWSGWTAVWTGIRLGLVTAVLAWSSAASAMPPARSTQECVNGYEGGQRLRLQGRLGEAREAFLACAQTSCPETISSECSHFLAEIKADIPTVVLGAVDPNGNDRVEVRVLVDGVPITEILDGRALEIDPGSHVIRYEVPGFEPVERYVVIRQGEKNRILLAQLTHRTSPSPVPAKASSPVLPLVFGGMSLASAAVAGGFYLAARNQRDDLRSSCAPWCDASAVDDVRAKLAVSTTLFAVSAAAAVGAVTVLLIRSRSARVGTSEISIAPLQSGVSGKLVVRF